MPKDHPDQRGGGAGPVGYQLRASGGSPGDSPLTTGHGSPPRDDPDHVARSRGRRPSTRRKAVATRLTRPIGSHEMTFESGKLAMQAGGSVVVTYGETQVLATTTTAAPREGIDFFPLTVDVEERMYAAGKIPGGFFRREGRPSETAILTARLIDRPMRPTFKDGYRDEVQIVVTVLSADMGNPYDVPGINAASLSTMIAGLPFDGPVG